MAVKQGRRVLEVRKVQRKATRRNTQAEMLYLAYPMETGAARRAGCCPAWRSLICLAGTSILERWLRLVRDEWEVARPPCVSHRSASSASHAPCRRSLVGRCAVRGELANWTLYRSWNRAQSMHSDSMDGASISRYATDRRVIAMTFLAHGPSHYCSSKLLFITIPS